MVGRVRLFIFGIIICGMLMMLRSDNGCVEFIFSMFD